MCVATGTEFAEVGGCVILNTEGVESSDYVRWMFDDKITLATKMNGENGQITYGTDESFKDRLELKKQNGSLKIKVVKSTNFGVYTLRNIDGKGRISNMKFSLASGGE